MKIKHLFLLMMALMCFSACENDDEMLVEGQDGLWTPTLSSSLIADGRVTLRWASLDPYMFSRSDVTTRCAMFSYVRPDRFEIYQSDHPYDGFTKIVEIKNNDQEIEYPVTGLTNGKPVYFRVKSLRKKYLTMESAPFFFIPNPAPASTTLISSKQVTSHGYYFTLSSKGEYLFYMDITSGQGLYTCRIDGSDKQHITDKIHWASCDSKGEGLYFITDLYEPNVAIHYYNCLTKETSTLTENFAGRTHLSISPNGKKILYNEYKANTNILCIHDVATGNDSTLMDHQMTGFSHLEPSWIDNENYLVKRMKMNGPYTINLSRVSLSDGKVEDLIEDVSLYAQLPALSPDGRYLAFVDGDYNARLMLYHVETKTMRQLTGYVPDTHFDIESNYLFWKDNQTLCFTENEYGKDTKHIRSLSIH